LFRGALRFKLEIYNILTGSGNAAGNFNAGYVAFVPGFVDTSAQPSTAAGWMLGTEFDNSHPALIRVSGTQTAEFEVPFSSIYHSQLLIQFEENDELYFGNQTAFGTLLLGLGTDGADSTFSYRLWVSYSDETRVGCFLGFPRQFLAKSMYPNWVVPPPPPPPRKH